MTPTTPGAHRDDLPDTAVQTDPTEPDSRRTSVRRARRPEERLRGAAAARDRFGGTNLGAAFFGWLVAVGMTVLLTALAAVVATAVGYSEEITQTEAERSAGTITLVTAAVLLAVLLVAYYCGGYVAGRMSRFDGGRQGAMVWLIGLLASVVAGALGWIAGDQYNLLDRGAVQRIPFPTDELTVAGVVTAIVVLLGTLLLAVVGGIVGRRYHDRVSRAAR